MERLVLFLCGVWFWLTRNERSAPYKESAETLTAARDYLWTEYNSRASTQERGFLLIDQVEALTILERRGSEAAQTARRFESVMECYRMVLEDLATQSSFAPEAEMASFAKRLVAVPARQTVQTVPTSTPASTLVRQAA
jgi:hypothetical protein